MLRDHPDQTVLEKWRRVVGDSHRGPVSGKESRRPVPDRSRLGVRARECGLHSGAGNTQSRLGSITRACRIPLRHAMVRGLSDDCVGGHGSVDGRGPCRGAADPEHHSVHLVASTRNDAGFEPVVSPDTARVAFVAVGQSDSPLFVRDLATLEAIPLPGSTGAKQPFWSPDGNAVAFFANGRLMKMALDGGEPVDLAAAPDARGGSWSRSGVIVFQPFFRDRGLARVSANGGEVQAATLLDVTTDDTTHKWPVFLPDGDHFLYLVLSVDESRRGIYVGVFRRSRRGRPRLFPTVSSVSYVVLEGHDTGWLLSVAGGCGYRRGRLTAIVGPLPHPAIDWNGCGRDVCALPGDDERPPRLLAPADTAVQPVFSSRRSVSTASN